MREILFRGKRVDNCEWVYGSYMFQPKRKGAFGQTVSELDSERHYISSKRNYEFWEVIHETVGEYTGLTDKNGKRIFEGDILSGGGDAYKVIFDEGVFQIENSHYITGVYVAIHMDKIDEVIGNIYDNPELLEVER